MPLRILLISPRGPLYRHRGGILRKSLRYAPLTLTTLAALVPPDVPADVSILDEGVSEVPDRAEADLVGISAITGSAPRAYELADRFRGRGVPVVLGGVHPTLMPDEAQAHADSVVTGYAELTWPRLLRDFSAGKMEKRYVQGPGFRFGGGPRPRREMLSPKDYVAFHTLEATRSCIHECEFCVAPTAWGGPFERPVGEVVDELRSMKARRVLFLDLNLISRREHALELFRAIAPLRLVWGGLTTLAIASDDELLDAAARSGCRGLLMGFESVCRDSLLETRKGFNARRDFPDAIRRVHARGISIMGCFAFGFDHDTPDVFDETAELVLESGVDLPRFAVLTPFPGTPLFARLKAEGRILTEDWSLYDAQHVVFRPRNMRPDELLAGIHRVWRSTYRYRSIAKRLLRSRVQLAVSLPANLGYRFYAFNLHRFYNCREALL